MSLHRFVAGSRIPRLVRSFSGDPPPYILHGNVKDIEELFSKYALDRESDPERISLLEREGVIPAAMAEKLRDRIKKAEEAARNARFWGRIVKFIGLPLLGGFAYYTYHAEVEHLKHWEEHPPERKKYPYLKWRVKKFFWGDGDKTLFHNDKYNW